VVCHIKVRLKVEDITNVVMEKVFGSKREEVTEG
jgi:hypothetical protein